jgi:hypothetical protein
MSQESNAHEPSHPGRHAVEGHRPGPDEHVVRERAYAIWVSEGKPDGRAVDHWLRARWELEQAPGPEAELRRLERELEPGRKTD